MFFVKSDIIRCGIEWDLYYSQAAVTFFKIQTFKIFTDISRDGIIEVILMGEF